jgi:hypothetical protein
MEITRIGPVSILLITPRYQLFRNLFALGKISFTTKFRQFLHYPFIATSGIVPKWGNRFVTKEDLKI